MPKFDRLIEFDERSRDYPIRTLVEDKARRSYTWSVGVSLNQGNEGACFPTGTLIRLADGSHTPIEKVRVLDEVVTAEGRTGFVLQTMVRRADSLAKVKVSGHGLISCTPDHPFLTQRGYVSAASLISEDRVAVVRYTPTTMEPLLPPDIVDLRNWRGAVEGSINSGGVTTEIAPLPEVLDRSPDLGRLLGLYVAEGYTTPQKVVWSFGGHEGDTLVPETMALIKTCFGAVARLQEGPNGDLNVVLYGKAWTLLFDALIPGTSKHGDKRLSHHVTCGPPEFLRSVIDGWLAGDGHRRRTSSHQLALDMHSLGTALGMRPTLRQSPPSMNSHARTRQTSWDVEFPEGGGSNLQPQSTTAVWRKVMSVDIEPWTGNVFNLHVEGDESYVAEGVGVHNCVGFGWAHELTARPKVRPMTNEQAFALYYEAQHLDAWEGNSYEGTSVIAGAKAVQAHGWLTEYRWAFGENDLALAVGYKGPAVLGVNWYSGMDNLAMDSKGRLWAHVSGQVRGGHCFITHGYSVPLNAYKCWNSWGYPSEFYISAPDMARLLNDYGEACIPVVRI